METWVHNSILPSTFPHWLHWLVPFVACFYSPSANAPLPPHPTPLLRMRQIRECLGGSETLKGDGEQDGNWPLSALLGVYIFL